MANAFIRERSHRFKWFSENLKAIGYNDIVAQEVLAPASELDVETRFAKSKAGFDRVFASL